MSSLKIYTFNIHLNYRDTQQGGAKTVFHEKTLEQFPTKYFILKVKLPICYLSDNMIDLFHRNHHHRRSSESDWFSETK
jgi:hypothetical protein